MKYYAYYAGEDGQEAPERTLPYGSEEVLRTEVNGKETVVCENRYALPLGYTYDQAMTQEELEQYDVLDRQEVMMQSVMLDEKTMTAWEKLQGEDEALEVKKKSMEEEKDATEQKKSMDEETNAPKQMESLEEETDAFRAERVWRKKRRMQPERMRRYR